MYTVFTTICGLGICLLFLLRKPRDPVRDVVLASLIIQSMNTNIPLGSSLSKGVIWEGMRWPNGWTTD